MSNETYSKKAKQARRVASQQERDSTRGDKKVDSMAKSKGSTANTILNRRDSTARALAKLGVK